VPLVACITSVALVPRSRKKSRMPGTVASPTPTVPIALDSTTVIAIGCRSKRRANAAAAIQPAVPPPAITIDRMGSGCAAINALLPCCGGISLQPVR